MRWRVIGKIVLWFSGFLFLLAVLSTITLYMYRDEICQMAISQMNKHLKAKVSVSKVELTFWRSFPNLAIQFEEVFIRDSYPNMTGEDTLLYTDRLRFKFDPWEIWSENYNIKSIDIADGVLHMKVNARGENNYAIFKESSDSTTQEKLNMELKNIRIENFRYRYSNRATGQDYHTLINEMEVAGSLSEKQFTASSSADLQVLNVRSGTVSLVKNKQASLNLKIDVNTENASFEIPTSTILISGLPFSFEGYVRNEAYRFSLNGKDLKIAEVANKLALGETEQIKQFSGEGNLIFNLIVHGISGSKNPAKMKCTFGVSDGSLVDPETGIALSDLSVKGLYTNEKGKSEEELSLNDVAFRTNAGLFKGSLRLTNFAAPRYQGKCDGRVNLGVLQSIIQLPPVEEIKGMVDLHTEFQVQTTQNEEGLRSYQVVHCDGEMGLNGVDLKLKGDRRVFQNISGQTYLRGDEIGLEHITLTIGTSDFTINGVFKEIAPYLSKQGKLDASVEVISHRIDLSDLSADSKAEKIMTERAFILPDNISGNVFLAVDKLLYAGHSFTKIKGDLFIAQRSFNFPRIAFSNGGADVKGNLTIEERRPEIFQLQCVLESQNIDFKKLFKEWNNFNQEVITSDNITGNVSAIVRIESPFDYRAGIIPNAIRAQVDLRIDEGRLKNVKAFRDITESLQTSSAAKLAIGKENIRAFEQKLTDLKFETLTNTLFIENSTLTIPAMSIRSTALDLEASGKHTFSNQIDYRIGFRFRDLKARKESEFGIEQDDGTGKYVFVRMHGNLDNPKIEWDKEASKEKRQEYMDQEKDDIKGMLKSEFGFFGKDTLVNKYSEKKESHEVLELELDPSEEAPKENSNKRTTKDTKTKRLLEKWKQESEGDKKEEFEIED